MLLASQVSSLQEAKELEAQLVKRVLQLAETLLRQAVTGRAAAYDEKVILDNSSRLLELAQLISQQP